MNEYGKKLTPALRFKGFTDDWERYKLGELANVVRGASPRPIQDDKWFDQTSDIGWLRIADVTAQKGKITFLEQKLSPEGMRKTRVLNSPHLLLSIAASVGKPVINYVKTGVHDGFIIFLNPKFDINFMFFWLTQFEREWQKYGQPGSQVNLNSEIVRNQKVLLPSNKEQIQINAFISKLDNLLTLYQRKSDKLELLKKEYLNRLFTNKTSKSYVRFKGFTDDWEQYKLQDIVEIQNNKRIPIEESKRIYGKIPYYGATGIQGYVEGKTHSGEYILLAEDGASNIYDYPVQFVTGDIWVNNHAHVMTSSNQLNKFLFYALKKAPIYRYVIGGGRAKLNLTDLKKIPISLCSIDEQNKIASFLNNLDESITLYQHKLVNLAKIKNVLLQKSFV